MNIGGGNTLAETTSDWITIVANIGFPICITMYLFLRFERKLENLEGSINKLTDVIKNLRKD